MERILNAPKCRPKVWKDVEAICNTFQANGPNQQFSFHTNGRNESNLVRDALVVLDPPRTESKQFSKVILIDQFPFVCTKLNLHILYLILTVFKSLSLSISIDEILSSAFKNKSNRGSWSWMIHQNVSKKKKHNKAKTDSYFTPWTQKRSLPCQHLSENVNKEHVNILKWRSV